MNEKSQINLKSIDKYETARYLGYKDNLPDVNMTKLILQAEKEMLEIIEPRFVYKVFNIKHNENSISLENAALELKGESITSHLKDCEKAVVLCATLSEGVDKILRKNELNNMVNALIIDALANAAIEQVCDEAEKIILSDFTEYGHTWRFGVGYGDFPLSTQKILLETLDAQKRIGVCATESCILTPRKSVTCIIGLSKKEVKHEQKNCKNCNLYETCGFRKNGTSCSK